MRDPDAILDELGASLRTAWEAEERTGAAGRHARTRPLAQLGGRWPRRWIAALCGVALVGGSAALATQDALRSPPLPELPASVRPPGAVAPDATTAPVLLAQGSEQGVGWRLSASSCRFGSVRTLGVFLAVPGGGAGTNCDVGSAAAGTLRVQSYFDSLTDRTWAFGALPAAARSVLAPGGRVVPALAADPATVARGIPAGARVFVFAVPGAQAAPDVSVRDGHGRPLLACSATRCSPPPSDQEPSP